MALGEGGVYAGTVNAGSADKNNVLDFSVQELAELVVFEREGSREGVSAAYGGVLGDAVILAGGCNFPGIPAAAGGPKVYYRTVYALRHPEQAGCQWEKVGKLAEEAANGASVTLPEGIVCIGGKNASGSLKAVGLLQWNKEHSEIVYRKLPDLPVAMDDVYAATDGYSIYVAGGNAGGKPANRCFVLQGIEAESWQELPPFPGHARLQPVAAVTGNKFYLLGGFQPVVGDHECVVATDGLCYDPETGTWAFAGEILPEGEESPVALVGAAGASAGQGKWLVVGGVDRSVFKTAVDNPLAQQKAQENGRSAELRRLQEEKAAYLQHLPEWYCFNRRILVYDPEVGSWQSAGDFAELAKAGAALVAYKDKWILINGESKPGIRSSGVYLIQRVK